MKRFNHPSAKAKSVVDEAREFIFTTLLSHIPVSAQFSLFLI